MLKIADETGFVILDTESSVRVIIDSYVVGGSNQAQSGSFTDTRLAIAPMTRPFAMATSLEVTGFVGYRPIITISGTTVSWSWPAQYSGYTYPRTRFIYGFK